MVDISDALSEQDKVKFTVHTKVGSIQGCYFPVTCFASGIPSTTKVVRVPGAGARLRNLLFHSNLSFEKCISQLNKHETFIQILS